MAGFIYRCRTCGKVSQVTTVYTSEQWLKQWKCTDCNGKNVEIIQADSPVVSKK